MQAHPSRQSEYPSVLQPHLAYIESLGLMQISPQAALIPQWSHCSGMHSLLQLLCTPCFLDFVLVFPATGLCLPFGLHRVPPDLMVAVLSLSMSKLACGLGENCSLGLILRGDPKQCCLVPTFHSVSWSPTYKFYF